MKALFALLGSSALLCSSLLTPHSSLHAQEPKKDKALTIRWFGHACFQVEDSTGHKFAFDPHYKAVFGRVPVRADFVMVSNPANEHSVIEMIDTGKKDAIIAPSDVYNGVMLTKSGKQEANPIDAKRGNIRIRNVATFRDTQNGQIRGKNAVFVIEVDGLTLCHLGGLGHELSDAQVKSIGKIDVLMIPVGGVKTINGEQAQAVVKQLSPRLYVLPMHYAVPGYDDVAGPDEFLNGFKNVVKTPDTNELVIPTDLKADEAKVVVMGWKKADPPAPPKK